VKQSPTQI